LNGAPSFRCGGETEPLENLSRFSKMALYGLYCVKGKGLTVGQFWGRESEQQVRPLRYPGFPVEVGGFIGFASFVGFSIAKKGPLG
jgi:hypothetical protein